MAKKKMDATKVSKRIMKKVVKTTKVVKKSAPIAGSTASLLAEGVNAVKHCVAKNDSREIFTNIFIKKEDSNLVFCATDGKRLGLIKLPCEVESDVLTKGMYLLGKDVKGFLDWLGGRGEFSFETMPNDYHMRVTGGDESFFMATSEQLGQFPNYERVIPNHYDISVEFDRKELVDILTDIKKNHVESERYLQYFVFEKEHGSTLFKLFPNKFVEDEGQVKSYEYELESRVVTLDTKDRLDLKLAFNVNYTLNALKATSSKKVIISFNTFSSPLRLEYRSEHLELIMPVRL